MSVLVRPDLQKRLKVCAAKLGLSRSTLLERFILDNLPEQEIQGLAYENAVPNKRLR